MDLTPGESAKTDNMHVLFSGKLRKQDQSTYCLVHLNWLEPNILGRFSTITRWSGLTGLGVGDTCKVACFRPCPLDLSACLL